MKGRLSLLVLVALAAVSLTANVAQAAKFTAGAYPASVFGEQAATPAPNTGIEGGTVFGFESKLMLECATATFAGSLTEASSALTVAPKLEGCRAFESILGSANPNGCETRFHATSGSGDEFGGTVDIVCPEGKKIVVTGNNCEVQIGAQSGVGGIKYVNETKSSPHSVILEFAVNSLTYTKTKDAIGCPLSGTGTLSDGVIAGSATVGATKGGEPIAFALE
ncbi:MAG TPA: hypothetical protein VFI17_08060 [Solirubrobacterales bacterium]|nr:hypothetical protein [Solirubrobacterales bacterium]